MTLEKSLKTCTRKSIPISNSTTGNDRLNGNIFLVVFIATFGTWFSLGYNIVALNGPQSVILTWIREIQCQRLTGNSTSNTTSTFPNSPKNQTYLWCHLIDTTDKGVMETLNTNSELNTIWALTSALFSLGGLVSALTSSQLIKRHGPKISILISAGVLTLGTIISCLSFLANSFEMLIVGRIVVGFALGSIVVLAPIYTSELTPSALRGALGTLPTIMFIIGMIVAAVLGLPFVLGNHWGWPVILALHLIPVMLMVAVLPFCPESPKHLFIREKKKLEAEKALKWLRQRENVKEELDIMQEELEKEQNRSQISLRGLFQNPFLRSTLWLATVPMIALHFSGYSCLSFYSTSIFNASGLTGLNSIYASVGLWITDLGISLVSSVLIDRVGRRTLLITSHVGVIISHAILVLTMALTRQGFSGTKYGSVACIFLFMISHGVGLMSVPWILGTELFTQEARAAAMTFVGFVCWTTELLATLVFPLVIAVAHEYTFLIFIGLVMVCGVFTAWKLPETKGKSIEEIQAVLRERFL